MRLGNAGTFFRTCQVAGVVFLVLLIALFISFQIGLDSPKADLATTPLSLQEFYSRTNHSGLPTSATNLFYARSSRGFTGFVDLYRFDAPAADCVAYGKHLLQGSAPLANLVPLSQPPDPVANNPNFNAMGLAEVRWFDVESIHVGFEGHQAPSQSGKPGLTIWIDTDRGRFFFYSSD